MIPLYEMFKIDQSTEAHSVVVDGWLSEAGDGGGGESGGCDFGQRVLEVMKGLRYRGGGECIKFLKIVHFKMLIFLFCEFHLKLKNKNARSSLPCTED